MSKASKYAERVKERPPRLELERNGRRHVAAKVNYEGGLDLYSESGVYIASFSPSEALRLADWLRDTFGENND